MSVFVPIVNSFVCSLNFAYAISSSAKSYIPSNSLPSAKLVTPHKIPTPNTTPAVSVDSGIVAVIATPRAIETPVEEIAVIVACIIPSS